MNLKGSNKIIYYKKKKFAEAYLNRDDLFFTI